MQGSRAVWSGDTVWMDNDGRFYFVGRIDGMLKTSGFRVSPVEVEAVAYETGMVGDAVLVGLPHERLGHELVLFVTEPREGEPDQDVFLDALRRALPTHLVPASIVWRTALPRTPNGKFDRVVLAAEAAQLLAGRA
jgi:acyl-coenzyme A synthetase/AMP-(fatty) acid ligase